MTSEQWQRDIDVNLTGAFRTVQVCLEGMRERRFGRIVAISSMAARSGLPGQVAYAASKAGLLGMVRTLAAEYADRGITANAVLPGMVATEVVRAMPAHVSEAIMATLPSGRMVEPSEVAAAVSFLASPEAAQVTGQAIAVEGAWSLNTRSLTGRGRPERE
jgi:NAD(P)-dependent dehydrogenase (short-subunit alcohol dehydrogenase family)